LVATDVTVTLTPGSTAPVVSVIRPANADVLPDWAGKGKAVKKDRKTRNRHE
jgi:hypothetical protein